MSQKTFFLTTPIYYPNARPHVGSAYTTIVCDVIARYKRMCGYDVAFLTGTDEHGEKLARAAAAEGKSPRDFVAEKRQLFVSLWEKLGIPVSVYPEGKPDTLRFIYTEHPDHVKSVQRLLVRARERGYIFSRRYEGRYCVSDERYVSDNTDPVNCDICGRPAELISEDNYFFKLSAFQDRLLELYGKHPEFVQPDYRRNEVISFVKSGLRDISVSRRRLKWGIPWPDDPEQVFYVWYDALTSYMTGIGYARAEKGLEFQKYWRNQVPGVRGQVSGLAPDTRHLTPDTRHLTPDTSSETPDTSEIVHMIGKDILRFHAVYWPAFIMAAYPDRPELLPTTVFAHGWIYYEQDKMSKSKGNVVYPEPIVDALDSFGAPGNDALRYYLLRETTFGQDTSFSYDALIQRYNSDLANDLGNLANRTITLIDRHFSGQMPALLGSSAALAKDREIQAQAEAARDKIRAAFDAYDFSRGLEGVRTLVGHLNKYLVESQPWVLVPGLPTANPAEAGAVLHTAAQAIRCMAVLLYPVIPAGAARLWTQFGATRSLKHESLNQIRWGDLKSGTRLGQPEPIFPRLDKEKTLAKLHDLADADYDRDKPKGASITVPSEIPASGTGVPPVQGDTAKPPTGSEQAAVPQTPQSGTGFQPVSQDTAKMAVPQITIDDFAKVDMRVGEIIAAEPIPKANKLLKLQVDIGTEVRQVCAGIAEHYKPEDLIGMKVVVVTNLEPRKLRGVESNGMIVAASVGEGGKPVLVTFKEEVPKGAKLK